MSVTEVFLGVIALSVLVMAVLQVTVLLMTARAVRHVGDSLGRVESSLRPILTQLQQMASDAARATAIATAQVERAEHLIDDVSRRVDETLTTVQETILGPARNGMAVFNGIKAALGSFFERGSGVRHPRMHTPSPAEGEDDASFIG